MDLPVIIAILAVIAAVLYASGAFGGEKKPEKKQNRSSESSSASKTAAAATSVTAAAAEKEKRGKKKNRSNKTKAQKAKARAAAVVAVSTTATVATVSAAEKTEAETQEEDSDSDSDSDSSDDDVPSGVRFQAQAHVQAEKVKAQKAAMLAKEKAHNKPSKSVLKNTDEAEKSHNEDDVDTPVTQITDAAHFDGWAVVEDKRKNKPKKAEDEPVSPVPVASSPIPTPVEVPEPTPAAPPAPVVETVTQELKVDPKKVGLLIGPKGATKIQIQTLTGANINMPKADKESTEPVTISVSGPALGVSKAVSALTDLVNKGYATLLEAEDFQESYVAVHPRYLPDVIGKAGATIRTLQQHTGVKIVVPATTKGPGPDGKVVKVKIVLAGRKEKVSQARALIKDLCKYYHTPVTHPGIVHEEIDLDSKYFNFIIGSKGSEIKNIQNTHKVQVHIPNADSVNPNLVIVGSETAVDHAKKHIEKIIARVDGAAEAAAAAAESAAIAAASAAPVDKEPAASSPKPAATSAPSWASKSRLPIAPKAEEVPAPTADEAWMNEFVPPTGGMDLSAMLPATAKFAPTPLLPAAIPAAPLASVPVEPAKKAPGAPSAWNNLSSLPAEKW